MMVVYMVTYVLFGLGGIGLTLVAGGVGWLLSHLDRSPEEIRDAQLDVAGEDLELRITRMEQKLELLPQTWEAFRDGSIKAEQRARHHARRAARESRQEPDDFEDSGPVPDIDGAGRNGRAVPAVHPSMGNGSAPVTENDWLRIAARVKGLM